MLHNIVNMLSAFEFHYLLCFSELPAGKGSLLPHAVSVFPDNYPQAKMLSLLFGSESHEVLPNSTAKSESEGQAWFCLPLWLL